MSLLDHSITDDVLINLVHSARPRSILLFEDIDNAGIDRELGNDNVSNITPKTKEKRSNITLSGLLNALDGVAAPEEHIIILITNKIEELDEALIRAGRISQKVPFDLAGPTTGCGMFLRFIHDDTYEPDLKSGKTQSTDEMSHKSTEYQTLCKLASAFGAQIPDQVYRPAEIQDYLPTHVDDSNGAVNDFPSMESSHHRRVRGCSAEEDTR